MKRITVGAIGVILVGILSLVAVRQCRSTMKSHAALAAEQTRCGNCDPARC
jgi:hypothetical protein